MERLRDIELIGVLLNLECYLEDHQVGFIEGVGHTKDRYEMMTLIDICSSYSGEGFVRSVVRDIEYGSYTHGNMSSGYKEFLKQINIWTELDD